jgi:HEAT repeat protein
MIVFYCPLCWAEFTKNTVHPPRCGAALHDVADQDEYTVKLMRALKHPESTTVVRAAALLGTLRERRAVQPLLTLLASASDPYILESTVEALGAIGEGAALDGLIEALAHSYVRVRGKAAEALAKFNDDRAGRALADAMNDPSEYVRALAAKSLTKFAPNTALAELP